MADGIDVNAMVGLITGAIAVAMQLQLAKDQLALKNFSPLFFLPLISKFFHFNPAEGEKRDKIDKPWWSWPRGDDAPSVQCRGLNPSLDMIEGN